MNKEQKRLLISFLCIVLVYITIFILIPTGKFVLVKSTFSIVNTKVPELTQNIPDLTWKEDNSYTINLTNYFNDTNDINFTTTAVQNITITIDNDTNLTTFNPDANFNGNRTLTITATDGYENTESNLFSLIINQIPDVKQSKFDSGDSNTTNFSKYNPIELQNLNNVTIHNATWGEIKFIENLNISGDVDLNANIEISENSIFINSTALPNFNKKANLTLYGLTFTNPKILRNGADCPSAICQKINYNNGILKFNVTGFSTYSAAETTSSSQQPSGGGKRVLEKEVEEELKPIKKPGKLFDVRITIPKKYLTIEQGNEIIGEIVLINLKHIGLVDVIIEYMIQDPQGNIIVKEFDTKGVEYEISYLKEILIPENLEDGDYLFIVKVNYIDDVAVSGYPFKVIKKSLPEKKPYLFTIFIIIAINLSLTIILYCYYKKIKNLIKKSNKISEKDYKKFLNKKRRSKKK